MPRLTIPFAGPRQEDRAFAVNAQRAINWYPTVEGDGAKAILTMKPTPGKTLRVTAGNGPIRSNIVTFQDRAVFVSGGQLLAVDTSWAVTSLGALNTTSGWCSIAAGRTYVVAVDGGDFYAFGVSPFTWGTGVFSIVTDSGDANYDADCPTSPSHVAYLDGYFIVNNAGSDGFNLSGNENPLTWDALDVGSAESDPDDVLAIATTRRDLYVHGEKTTEVYYNSGNADFPFDLYANGVLGLGIHAPHSVATDGNRIYMLAVTDKSSPFPVFLQGFQAQKISDPDIAYTLSQMTTTSDALGMVYTQADETFYELTFPTEDLTLVYHVEQDQWHERQSGSVERHRVQGHGYFNGMHLVGDYISGKVYSLDPAVYTEDGATIKRKRVAQILHRDGRQIEVNCLEVEMKRGVGLVSGQGSDPQVMLRYSIDGGHEWSIELWRGFGAQGDYDAKCVWNRLGTADSFLFELTESDPVDAQIINAYADVEVLGP